MAEDFQPEAVQTPPAPVVAREPDAAAPACLGPGSCCASDDDCAAGEACSSGTCSATVPPDADNGMPVACSGSDCAALPGLLVASCSDGEQNGNEGGIDCGAGCPEPCDTGSSCTRGDECRSRNCSEGRCAEAACDDLIQNGNETGIDCGGTCAGDCAEGAGCRTDDDCGEALFCPAATATCTSISCQDGALNGGEILVDCGGGSCPGCAAGTACAAGNDCESRVCGDDDRCAEASCGDGVQNQDEDGPDCGGSCARPCLAIGCEDDGDCDDTRCADVGCAGGLDECCQPPSCVDDLLNGTETSEDCGGNNACARCPNGAACVEGSDCISGICSDNECVSCGDSQQNGLETGIDCGGPVGVCPRCQPGGGCALDGDCASGICEAGRCCGGTVVDCTRCAERLSATANCTDVDPAAQGSCIGFLQCLANNPALCPTRYAPGCSAEGGVCNHNFYGGDGSVGLLQANAVIGNAGCQF